MALDKLVNHLLETVRNEERANKASPLGGFTVERTAKSLLEPTRKCGSHHRGREQHYTSVLEAAEKELREKGVSVEVWDPSQGMTIPFTNLGSGSVSNAQQQFQPQIDQRLLNAVKNAKAKMLEHRGKAEQYERFARAFAVAPNDAKIELTVYDVEFFRLEE